jgi:hypothetical protein
MLLEEDILRIKYGIDGNRDVHGFILDDFLWNPIATFLLKRFRLLRAILVAWILWPK